MKPELKRLLKGAVVAAMAAVAAVAFASCAAVLGRYHRQALSDVIQRSGGPIWAGEVQP